MRELRASEKMDIVELAVTMQTGVCPFIVGFYGCLIRDVSFLGSWVVVVFLVHKSPSSEVEVSPSARGEGGGYSEQYYWQTPANIRPINLKGHPFLSRHQSAKTQCWVHICMYVRPQKHVQK